MTQLSKTQVDRLGDRLRAEEASETDLRLLDDYRRSFKEPYEMVVDTLLKKLSIEPTGRPAKSTTSLREKLRRESIRLSQVQDIAGCRILVSDIIEQEQIVKRLEKIFEKTIISNRREKPSHGYQAVHVIVKASDKLIEIQVRSKLQHLWAEFSERLSDFSPGIKYGEGSVQEQRALMQSSRLIKEIEDLQLQIQRFKENPDAKAVKSDLVRLQKRLNIAKNQMERNLSEATSSLERNKK